MEDSALVSRGSHARSSKQDLDEPVDFVVELSRVGGAYEHVRKRESLSQVLSKWSSLLSFVPSNELFSLRPKLVAPFPDRPRKPLGESIDSHLPRHVYPEENELI